MSPPCTNFLSPDPAAAVASPALPGPAASSPARAADADTPSFDTVLAQAGDAAPAASAAAAATGATKAAADDKSAATPAKASDDSDAADEATASPPPLTPEQLLLMASLVVQAPVAATPQPQAPATAAPEASAAADTPLTPVGAAGRSVPQLLATGVAVLEYDVAPAAPATPAASAQSAAPAQNAAPIQGAVAAGPGSADAAGAKPEKSAAKAALAASVAVTATIQTPAGSRTVTAAYGINAAASVQKAGAATPGLLPTDTPAAAAPDAPAAATQTVADASLVGAPADGAVSAVPGGKAAAGAAPTPGTSAAGSAKPAQRPGEKLAEETAATLASRGKSPDVRGKNTFQVLSDKEVADNVAGVGTTAANGGKPMKEDSQKTAALPTADIQVGVTSTHSTASSGFSATLSTSPASQAHAGQLVHEIREIADGLWAVDRNSVEVKFNFGETERLSVRVEYRDGSVQATFRTDSPELRDVIAREWQVQSHSAERPYRVADPVFSSASGFSLGGGDTSRQQQNQNAANAVPFERLAGSAAGRSGPSTPSTSATAPATRPETAGYLHALV